MKPPRYSVMPRSESVVAKNLRRRDPHWVNSYINIDDYQRRQPAVNGKGEMNPSPRLQHAAIRAGLFMRDRFRLEELPARATL